MPSLDVTTTPTYLPAEGTLTISKVGGDTLSYGLASSFSLQNPVSASNRTGTITGSLTSLDVGVWLVSAGATTITWSNDANDDLVQANEIATGAVTTAKLADDSVTGDKVSDGIVAYSDLGAPDLAVDDHFLNSVDMQATAYTLDETEQLADNPPRNVTITHTAVDTADTLGDAVVTGTNVDDEVITETITIVEDDVAVGLKAFKTVTSVVTADWVIDGVEGSEDTIEVGFGNVLGLHRPASSVALTTLGTAIITPTSVVDEETPVEENTVDISSGTYDGTKVAKAFVTP